MRSTAPPVALKSSLHAEVAGAFELRMERRLWSPDNPALLRACAGARRALAVHDSPSAGERLTAYLGRWLDGHQVLDGRVLDGMCGPDAVRAVVRAAVAARLGRRDAFLSVARGPVTATTALSAVMFRRYAHAVRVHDDLLSVLASVRAGNRVVAPDGTLAADQRDTVVLVDVDAVVADRRPLCPEEVAALRHLADFDVALAPADPTADPAGARAEALHAVVRLIRRYGVGEHPVWRLPAVIEASPRSLGLRGGHPDHGGGAGTPAERVEVDAAGTGPGAVRMRRALQRSYPVTFTAGVLAPDSAALSAYLPLGARVLAVVDDFSAAVTAAVRRTLGDRYRRGRLAGFEVLPVRSTRTGKTFEAAEEMIGVARRMGLGPADRIVAVGGGTVLDMAGHVAAFHAGGTGYLRIPTTLVGLVDAGIGLKVGVDLDGRKSLVGAYHPPLACLCDPGFLATLPAAEFRCGLAEIVKIALVRDARLFHLVEEHHGALRDPFAAPVLDEVLRRAVAAMLAELEDNPVERRLRRLPDFGHEFGHVLEERSGHRLRHGEAVAIGMALSCRLGVAAGRLAASVAERVEALLHRIGLPTYHDCCSADDLWRALHTDVLPHKGGGLHLVVPTGIGAGGFVESIDEIGPDDLYRAWTGLRERAGRRL